MREYRERFNRKCDHCKTPFQSVTRQQKYCVPDCRTAAEIARRRRRPGDWLSVELKCGVCRKAFFRTLATGPNKKYCSEGCSYQANLLSQKRFHKANPDAQTAFRDRSKKRLKNDTLMDRLRKKYTDLPTVCEALGCGEGRVLDIAHKPEHRRLCRHRIISLHYQRHKFWILCPTHHALIDRNVSQPAELGLS